MQSGRSSKSLKSSNQPCTMRLTMLIYNAAMRSVAACLDFVRDFKSGSFLQQQELGKITHLALKPSAYRVLRAICVEIGLASIEIFDEFREVLLTIIEDTPSLTIRASMDVCLPHLELL